MALEPEFASLNTCALSEWDEVFFNPNFISFEDMFGLQNAPEAVQFSTPSDSASPYGFLATPPGIRSAEETAPDRPLAPHNIPSLSGFMSQIVTPANDAPQICAVCSGSASVPPPPPVLESIVFLPSKWHKIPQDTYSQKQWDYRASAPIPFQANGSPGFNMGQALNKKFATLEGWDDLVLEGAKGVISCRLLFPGYPLNGYPQISTRYWNRNRDPITRGKLAHEVARKLKQYLDTMNASYVMDVSIDDQWRIGHGFMHLENIFLTRLVSVSKGSYQPELWVLDPTK